LYKSGKYYIARVNVNTVLNKPALKIYDENEHEVDMESINDNTNVVTIVEIQGIKCSSRSFQIEIDLKQMMVLQPTNPFEKCIIKSSSNPSFIQTNDNDIQEEDDNYIVNTEPLIEIETSDELEESLENIEKETVVEETLINTETEVLAEPEPEVKEEPLKNNIVTEVIHVSEDGLQEIDFDLEDLTESEPLQIKKRNDVYYDMYREARRKAKVARDLALSAYLEAKRIKNTYMLNDMDDSEDSDLEMENDENNDEEDSVDE
jgi:hypothetical protein